MNIYVFSTMLLVLTFHSFASEVDASFLEAETKRELLFTLKPKDALKCGNEIIGDHLADANVTKVTHSTNEGIYVYYEVSDNLNYTFRCQEKTVQKLINYFDSIIENKKVKNLARVYQSTVNSIICKTDKESLNQDFSQRTQFIVLKKVFGQREISPYFSNEINFEIYNDKNTKIGSCDEMTTNIKSFENNSEFSEVEHFNSKLSQIKKEIADKFNSQSEAYENYTIGGCILELSKRNWDINGVSEMKLTSTFLLRSTKVIYHGMIRTSTPGWDNLMNQENCMLKP